MIRNTPQKTTFKNTVKFSWIFVREIEFIEIENFDLRFEFSHQKNPEKTNLQKFCIYSKICGQKDWNNYWHTLRRKKCVHSRESFWWIHKIVYWLKEIFWLNLMITLNLLKVTTIFGWINRILLSIIITIYIYILPNFFGL